MNAGVPPPESAGLVKKFIEGPVRKSLEWLVGVTTVHPSTHRLKNAVGLSVGLMGGRYVMDRVVGETPDGDKIDKEDVPSPLRPIHGAMAYNHYSDDPSDRWKHVVDMWVPAAMGATGAVLGSQNFGLEQPLILEAEKALRDPKLLTIDKAEDAALMLQGKVHRVLAGGTAMFGSSSNLALVPSPANYGVELGAAFLPYVRRNKLQTPWAPKLQQFMSANKHDFAFGPTGMLVKLKEDLLQNPESNPESFAKKAAAILEPWFGERVTDQHIEAFLKPMVEARDKAYKPGGVPMAARAELGKALDGFLSGAGLEKHLLANVKLNPAEAMIGRNGAMEFISRSLGAEPLMEKLEESFRKGVASRHGLKELPDLAVNAATRAADKRMLVGGTLVAGGMVAGIAYLAQQAVAAQEAKHSGKAAAHPSAPDVMPAENSGTAGTDKAAAAATGVSPAPSPSSAPPKKERSGGVVLNTAERVTEMLNAPLSLSKHRTICALGLSTGGLIGTEIANVIAGRTLTGAPLPEERVPDVLKKLYKTMPYNPHSAASKDRWGYILHFGIPAVTAAAGVIVASDMYFKSRKKRIDGESEYLEDFENRATMAMANAFTVPTALTALPVTPSGFACLPFSNYGSMLGTRFTLAAGRKGVMPGLGQLWNGSTSRFAEGPVALRDRMIHEAVNNPAEHPEQLEEMSRGIVRQFFPEATDAQVHAFVEKMEKDRAPYFKEGVGVPDAVKEDLEKVLNKHFKDAGLERTFREMGLDPMNAILGNNGLSGTIATYLGAAKPLEDINAEFKKKYTERLKTERARGSAQPAAQMGA